MFSPQTLIHNFLREVFSKFHGNMCLY
jgi:hypothetical protein